MRSACWSMSLSLLRYPIARPHDIDQDQANHHSHCRGRDVDADCAAAHTGQLGEVVQGRHPGDQGAQHQGHGDELQAAQKDLAPGRHPICGELNPAGAGRDNAVNGSGNETDDDLPVELTVPGHRLLATS